MRETCVLTVRGLRKSASAISRLVLPRATRPSTSSSRGLSSSRPSGVAAAACSGCAMYASMRRLVTLGASRDSPAATRRIAESRSLGSPPLRRKPRVDLPAATLRGACCHVASECGGALAHATQSVAAGGRGGSVPIVGHLDVQHVRLDMQVDARARGGGVAHYVRECLLDDAKA